ncbi:MAG: hypothetical protein Q7T90_07275 [Thiobacillus sp.]|nr:hypothetical protein [Thiobacillus sp.]
MNKPGYSEFMIVRPFGPEERALIVFAKKVGLSAKAAGQADLSICQVFGPKQSKHRSTFELTGWTPQAASPSGTKWSGFERIVRLHCLNAGSLPLCPLLDTTHKSAVCAKSGNWCVVEMCQFRNLIPSIQK